MESINVGALGKDPVILEKSLSSAKASEVFTFTTLDFGNVNVALTNISANDDVDVQLFKDDGDGIFEPTSGDEYIAAGPRPSNLDESINVSNQQAGKYFAEVSRFDLGSQSDSSYKISFSSSNPSNLIAIDNKLGDLSVDRVFNGNLSNDDTSDIFSFSLDTFEGAEFILPPVGGNADLRLIKDTNRNGVIDVGETVLASTNAGSRPDTLRVDKPGDYILQAYQVDPTDINYTLVVDYFSTTISSGQVLGNVGNTPVTRKGNLATSDQTDVFLFSNRNAGTFSNINLSLTNINEGGDANLSLYQDDGDGVFEPNGDDTFVSTAVRRTNADDSINVSDLLSGDYFAAVSQGSNSVNPTSYNLAISTSDPSNLLLNEIPLGNLTKDQSINANLSNSDSSDFFTFSLGFNDSAKIAMTPRGGNADIRLISDINKNGQVDLNEILASSASLGTKTDSITVNDQGSYFLQVYQVAGDPINYNLNFDYSSTALA
jgi:hypothetical protein